MFGDKHIFFKDFNNEQNAEIVGRLDGRLLASIYIYLIFTCQNLPQNTAVLHFTQVLLILAKLGAQSFFIYTQKLDIWAKLNIYSFMGVNIHDIET